MHDATQTRSVLAFGIITAACLMLCPMAAHAQRPTVDAALATRARNACDAAAAKAGYNIMRRDNETRATTTIAFPMHVRHGTEEADVTCTYDTHRGVATYSAFQAQRAERAARREETREARAQRLCRDYANAKAGYRVERVGDATQHGVNWDVPLRVRRNGRTNVSVTCRYNSANSKLSLR